MHVDERHEESSEYYRMSLKTVKALRLATELLPSQAGRARGVMAGLSSNGRGKAARPRSPEESNSTVSWQKRCKYCDKMFHHPPALTAHEKGHEREVGGGRMGSGGVGGGGSAGSSSNGGGWGGVMAGLSGNGNGRERHSADSRGLDRHRNNQKMLRIKYKAGRHGSSDGVAVVGGRVGIDKTRRSGDGREKRLRLFARYNRFMTFHLKKTLELQKQAGASYGEVKRILAATWRGMSGKEKARWDDPASAGANGELAEKRKGSREEETSGPVSVRAGNRGDVGRWCRKRKQGEEARAIMEGGGAASGGGRRAKRRKDDGADRGRGRGNSVKRMPMSLSDTVGKDADMYTPEKIVGQRRAKGDVTQWKVKWVGWENKHNTWEPIEHLAGCDKLIAEFQEREKTRIAQIEEANRMEKGAAATSTAAAAAPFVANVD